MSVNHTKHGFNQYTDIVSVSSGVSYSLPGIEVGDRILRASTAHWATSSGSLTTVVRTAAQFTVSAANTVRYKGSNKSYPDMLVAITWVDIDGDKAGV